MNYIKINFIFLLLLISVAIFISGCGNNHAESQASTEVIKIATNYWPGKFWIQIANEKGWFKEAGLNVEIVDVFNDYYGSIQDTIDGKTHINGVSMYDLVNYNSHGDHLVLIINTDNAGTSDGLVVKKKIKDFSQLRNKKIAVSEGFYTEYMLTIILEEHGLTLNDLIIVNNIKDEHMADEFISGSIDGFISWQPHTTRAITAGGHLLWTAEQNPGISPNGQVVLNSFLEENQVVLQTYVNVWHKTTEWMKVNEQQALEIISDIYGFTLKEVELFYHSEYIPDLYDNKLAFSYSAGFESLHGTARQINRFMRRNNITNNILDSTTFIDNRFIRKINQ
jgi:NitT/TauT family transport system substrate-binding protein